MDDKFYVLSIIRDDDERFDFDGREIYLSSDNILLVRPDIESSEVEYTDTDGGEMIQQRLQTNEQSFSGIIYPKETEYWTLYFNLGSFFQINHYYTIIYRTRNADLLAQRSAWLSHNLQVSPTAQEDYSNFTVSFKMKNSLLYEYAEDSSGNVIFANKVILPLISSSSGGEVWDSVGQVWDSVGSKWESGSGGVQSVNIASVAPIYPVWTVVGPSINPSLQNNTTDTVATYTGTVATGQTLVVDFAAGTAKLDGAIVSRNLTGQVRFEPGDNIAGFNSTGGSTTSSTIEWDNVRG